MNQTTVHGAFRIHTLTSLHRGFRWLISLNDTIVWSSEPVFEDRLSAQSAAEDRLRAELILSLATLR